jgi:hypothetical protein
LVNGLAADEPPTLARSFELANYPNPFNASTVISFSLPQTSDVHLRVFDVTGREVFRHDLGRIESGTHHLSFDASGLASGVYVARLETPGASINRKMILLR